MKVSTWRRLTALLLCIVMLLGLFVTTAPEAYADENNAPVIKKDVESTKTNVAYAYYAWKLDLSKIFEDTDGDTLTYKVKVNDAAAVDAKASYSYTPTAVGTTMLVFTASDGKATSPEYTVTLNVTRPYLTEFGLVGDYQYLYDSTSNATVGCKIKRFSITNDNLEKRSGRPYAGTIHITVGAPYKFDTDKSLTNSRGALPNSLWLAKDNYTVKGSEGWTVDKKLLKATQGSKDPKEYTVADTSLRNNAVVIKMGSNSYYYGMAVTVEIDSTENIAPGLKTGVTNPATAEVTVNTPWTLNLASIFEDVDGDALTYTVKVNGAAAVAANASYSYTPTAVGDTTLVFTANDGKADSLDTYTVTLTAVAPRYKINKSTDRYVVNSYTSPMGTIETTVDGTSVSEAAEGVTVVAKAVPQKCSPDGKDYYDAKFDHWEVTGLTGIDEAALKNAELTFTMPATPVSLKAVFVKVGSPVTLTANDFTAGDVTLRLGDSQFASTYDDTAGFHKYDSITDTMISGATISASIATVDTANTNFKLKEWEVTNTTTNDPVPVYYKELGTKLGTVKCPYFTVDGTSSYTIKAIFEAKDYADVNVTVSDAAMGTATAQVGTADASTSLTAVTEETTVKLHAAPADGFIFKSWKATYGDDGVVTVTDSDKADASFVMPATDKKPINVVAAFEKDPEKLSKECALTDAVLLDGDGNPLGLSDRSGTNYTITVPADTDTGKLGELTLKLTASAYATVKKVGDKEPWPAEGKKCGMDLDALTVFVVTAEDGTTETAYTITIKQKAAPDAPTLSDGSATRTGKNSATVTFTSSEAGTYFYGTSETVDTTKNGSSASAGENSFTLPNLTESASSIYIVVKNASGVESAPLKVDIPAYGDSTVPDTGSFTVSVTAPKGGTLTTNRTKADKGDEIIVTVTPDSGYQMVEGSLTYSLAVAGGETFKITGNRFTMPAGNVTITCKWETATVSAKGITAFTINGVSAAVNNTTNVITITLPRGTDVTKLTPVISTSGVKSLSPASGKTVDFTNSVTYTATMDDGSTKAYTVTVYVDKGSLADQFWDKLTDFYNQTPWWQYAEHQQSTKKYPKYW